MYSNNWWKEVMNEKSSGEEYLGSLGGKKAKGEMLKLKYNLRNKICKDKIKQEFYYFNFSI